MVDLVEKSTPTITTFGAAVTKGKIAGNAIEVEDTIADIIRNWRHMIGTNLVKELSEFAVNAARASAHLVINWIVTKKDDEEGKSGSGGGFTLPVDMLVYLKNLDNANREKDLERERERGRGTLRRKMPVVKPKN